MQAARHILNRFAAMPVLRRDLIQHEVPEGDRDWYARCRIEQFARFPWVIGDAVRGLFALWLLLPAPDLVVSIALLALIAISVAELGLRHALNRPFANSSRQLTYIRVFLMARGAVWAMICAILVRQGGPDLATVMMIALGWLMFDILFTMSLPLTGLAAGSLVVFAIGGALLQVPGVRAMIVLAAMTIMLLGLHYAVFNLHYLFATRRLRTHRLRQANDTIGLLLKQYDEHSADALVEVDSEGRLRQPSARLCEMLGRDCAKLEGVPIAELFEPGRERNAMLNAARSQRRFRNHVVPLRIAGARHWWSISGGAVINAQGRDEGYRCFIQDITEQRANEERIRIMATRDNLTGLVNRAIFTDRLTDVLSRSGPGSECAVLFIDLDSFKLVNDTYGHAAGDTVLIEAGRRIEGMLGPDMIAARLGATSSRCWPGTSQTAPNWCATAKRSSPNCPSRSCATT